MRRSMLLLLAGVVLLEAGCSSYRQMLYRTRRLPHIYELDYEQDCEQLPWAPPYLEGGDDYVVDRRYESPRLPDIPASYYRRTDKQKRIGIASQGGLSIQSGVTIPTHHFDDDE